MLKMNDVNDQVRALQKTLMTLGYSLPRWGADGDLGVETLEAFSQFLRDHGTGSDDDKLEITDEELALLMNIAGSTAGQSVPAVAGDKFHDIRAIAQQDRVRGRRAWQSITGITLHQTACVLGERPARWTPIAAHIGVTRAGQVIWMHDFEKNVQHGNGFNAFTVGIELDGQYEGVEGDIQTFWRPLGSQVSPQRPTAELVTAALAAVRWVCAEVARHSGTVTHLFAHRQASALRQSDPGSAIWQKVALTLMAELGLQDGGLGHKIGTGLAIPERWDKRRVGVRY